MDMAVVQNWRDVLVSADDWQPTTTRPARARRLRWRLDAVRSNWGRVAWLKPAATGLGCSTAAKEKIAADLAHEIGIRLVPPVLLYGNSEQLGSLSLVCHPKSHSFQDLMVPVAGAAPGTLATSASFINLISDGFDSGIVALDALVRNTDRINLGNTMLGTSGQEFEFLFIDFSHAMVWAAANYDRFDKVLLPPPLLSMLNRKDAEAAAARIEQLPDDAIIEVVQRIPDDFANPAARRLLLDGLLVRKRSLLASTHLWYP